MENHRHVYRYSTEDHLKRGKPRWICNICVKELDFLEGMKILDFGEERIKLAESFLNPKKK